MSTKSGWRLAIAVTFTFLAIIMTNSSQAGQIISPVEASKEVKAGTMVLIDIRRPSEWQQSGIPEGALPVSMHERSFLEEFYKVMSENKGKTIGVICATGSRSSWLQNELSKRKIAEVVDVSEGMFGNRRGPGWLARGLPIKKYP